MQIVAPSISEQSAPLPLSQNDEPVPMEDWMISIDMYSKDVSIKDDPPGGMDAQPTLYNHDKDVTLKTETIEDVTERTEEAPTERSELGNEKKVVSQKTQLKRGVVFLQLVCVIVAVAQTIPAISNEGHLCPRETICATDQLSVVLLGGARISAYWMYPCLVLIFLSKSHALELFLLQTQVSVWMPINDMHHLHVLCGHFIHIATWVHTVTHVIRWAINGELHFLAGHVSGHTGLLAFFCCLLVVLPMGYGFVRQRLSFEIRKTAHSIFSVSFGIGLMFHAPKTNILLVIGIAVVTFVVDWLYIQFFKTYKVKSSVFHRLEDGVQLTFKNPRGFDSEVGGYVLVMVPWICKSEWHAFSVFPHPTMAEHSCVVIARVGTWTRTLRHEVERDTRRPSWIQGPFASPFSTSVEYDNLILVATGIGITPCLGLINNMKEERRINLIWMCRDASLLEFMLNSVTFDDDAFSLIYYTGKRKLNLTKELPQMVYVFSHRPNLKNAVTNIVHAIESGVFSDALEEESKKLVEESHDYANLLATANERNLQTRARLVIAHAMQGSSIQEFMQKIRGMRGPHSPKGITRSRSPHLKGGLLRDVTPDGNAHNSWSRKGLQRLFSSLAPQVLFSDAEFDEVFKMFDEDGSGTVDQEELEAYCRQVINDTTMKADEKQKSSLASTLNDDSDNISAVQVKELAKTWQALYCGGSVPVIKELKQISSDLGMSFRVEKFDW